MNNYTILNEPDRMRLCMWLYEIPAHKQCVVQIDGQYYVANQTLGLRSAVDDDLDRNPGLTPPDWLIAAVRGRVTDA